MNRYRILLKQQEVLSATFQRNISHHRLIGDMLHLRAYWYKIPHLLTTKDQDRHALDLCDTLKELKFQRKALADHMRKVKQDLHRTKCTIDRLWREHHREQTNINHK